MDRNVEKLIREGKYDEAEQIAFESYCEYKTDEAPEIYNELYDRIIDEKGRNSGDAVEIMKRLAEVTSE